MSKGPPLWKAIRLTVAAFRRDNASRFGAALAFYIVFSIAPTLLIAIGVAGNFFGRRQAEREILERISGSFGSAAGVAIAAMIKDAATRRTGWLASLLGLMTLYFGLTGVYRQVDDALRTIWGQKRERRVGTIRAMLLVLAAGIVVLLSVAADAAIAVTGRYAAARLVGGELLWHAAQLLVSTLVLTGLFAAVFRSLARVTWGEVRLGAAVTAILFVLGKFALGIYLGKAAVGSAFGAAGSIVVVLLWSYWSAQIFFFGLEFIHVTATGARPRTAS
jgi:membrane protein